MQKNGWLAHDPPLVAREADGVEAVIEILILSGGDLFAEPRLAAILRFQQGLTSAEQKACIKSKTVSESSSPP